MVEFALIVPILLALLFGIISYGYMLSYRQAITQAATEGARAAALAPQGVDLSTRARSAVNRSLEPYGVTCTTAGNLSRNGSTVGTCTIPSATAACANATSKPCVTVRITHNYRDKPLIPSFPGLGITLPSTVTFASVIEAN